MKFQHYFGLSTLLCTLHVGVAQSILYITLAQVLYLIILFAHNHSTPSSFKLSNAYTMGTRQLKEYLPIFLYIHTNTPAQSKLRALFRVQNLTRLTFVKWNFVIIMYVIHLVQLA